MKKRNTKNYGTPLFLYPGMILRVGSMVVLDTPSKDFKKQSVDKFVDKLVVSASISKNKRARAVCLKNRH